MAMLGSFITVANLAHRPPVVTVVAVDESKTPLVSFFIYGIGKPVIMEGKQANSDEAAKLGDSSTYGIYQINTNCEETDREKDSAVYFRQ
jgi:hypothetical protein